MRKLFLIFTGVIFAIEIAWASPIGPVVPRRARPALGFEFASNQRDMKKVNVAQDLRQTDRIYGLLRLDYGISDKVEASLRMGSATLRYDDLVDVNGVRTRLDGGSELAWGGQIAAIVYEAPTWKLAGIANFLAHSQHSGLWPGLGQAELDYREWSFGLQAQGRFQRLTPYVGLKYTGARVDYTSPAGTSDDESDDHTGLYLGTGFDLNPRWSSYIEGRFADETSFGAGVRYTY